MATQTATSEDRLTGVAGGDLSVLDALERMTRGSFKDSGLDPKTFMMVRMAALATLGAAPASWLANIAVAKQVDLTAEDGLGLLIALAPLIGSARVVSAAGGIIRALGLAEELEEEE